MPPDALGTVLRATVHWGDGSSSPADVTGSGSWRTVVATHRYRRPGTYRPRVVLTDAVEGTALAARRATVSVRR